MNISNSNKKWKSLSRKEKEELLRGLGMGEDAENQNSDEYQGERELGNEEPSLLGRLIAEHRVSNDHEELKKGFEDEEYDLGGGIEDKTSDD